jgi:hypothetical protein
MGESSLARVAKSIETSFEPWNCGYAGILWPKVLEF